MSALLVLVEKKPNNTQDPKMLGRQLNFEELASPQFVVFLRRPPHTDVVSQNIEFKQEELTFLFVAVKFCAFESFHYHVDMLFMLVNGVRPDDNVINVNVAKFTNVLT